jgi:dUTP pyrophosphatase
MKFQIQCATERAKKYYINHSTFHEGDSGLDLFILQEEILIPAGETVLVGLEIHCQLYSEETKKYHSYMIFPRSSIYKTPLRLANSIGLCDAGYTGELKIALHNTSTSPFSIHQGERYVQLVAPQLQEIEFELVTALRETSRGKNGFGSTNS